MATNSSYSEKVLDCGSRACAKCGYCRDWYWSSDGKNKSYKKRPAATCTASYAYGLLGYGSGCRGCAICCLNQIPWVRHCAGQYYGGAGVPLNGYLTGGVNYHIDTLAGVDIDARRTRNHAGCLVDVFGGSGIGSIASGIADMSDGTLSKRMAIYRDHHDVGRLCECSDNQQ